MKSPDPVAQSLACQWAWPQIVAPKNDARKIKYFSNLANFSHFSTTDYFLPFIYLTSPSSFLLARSKSIRFFFSPSRPISRSSTCASSFPFALVSTSTFPSSFWRSAMVPRWPSVRPFFSFSNFAIDSATEPSSSATFLTFIEHFNMKCLARKLRFFVCGLSAFTGNISLSRWQVVARIRNFHGFATKHFYLSRFRNFSAFPTKHGFVTVFLISQLSFYSVNVKKTRFCNQKKVKLCLQSCEPRRNLEREGRFATFGKLGRQEHGCEVMLSCEAISVVREENITIKKRIITKT